MVGVIFAMDNELEGFLNLFDDKKTHEIENIVVYEVLLETTKIYVTKSGIGKVNAAYVTTQFLNLFPVNYLFNTGIAGGVGVNKGEIVLASKTFYHDADATVFGYERGQIPGMPAFYEASSYLLEQFKRSIDAPYKEGSIVSGDSFVTSMSALEGFDTNTIYAIDMESTAIAQISHRYNVPFLAFRIISDVIGENTEGTLESDVTNAIDISARALKKVCTLL